MTAEFVGRHVSINCGPSLGYFQGQIKAVDTALQTISISNPYKNGVQCNFPEVILASQDIVDLTLIDDIAETSKSTQKTEAKSNKSTGNSVSKSNNSHKLPTSQPTKVFESVFSHSQSPPRLTHSFKEQRHSQLRDGRPQPHAFQRPRAASYRNQDDCFNVDCNDFSEDFDFEKNLALFDKQALYDEVYSGSDGEVRTPVKSRSRGKSVAKYRHDENVLESQPTVYRQIVINNSIKSEVTEYYTDAGLVIPCIGYELHNKICNAAVEMGINHTRQLEVFGLNASQMALNLLGGSNRLHPRNAHQRPQVVVFAGPHHVGAQGIATARHLATQNIHVQVFLANFVKMNDSLQEELKLLSLTTANLVNDIKDLSTSPVDLVILAVDDDQSIFLRKQSWYDSVTLWCSRSIAPILCLCPPEEKVGRLAVNVRWSVCSVLPRSLSPSYGMTYLVDLCFPEKVFRKVGIQYRSPFCAKSYIALHTSQ